MRNLISVLSSTVLISTCLMSCNQNNQSLQALPQINTNQAINTFSNIIEKPEFSRRKLGLLDQARTNSLSYQKQKQIKLHSYYFQSFSKSQDSYEINSNNSHINMLKIAEKEIGLSVDNNSDGKVDFSEVKRFVSSSQYIQFFRNRYVLSSFKKLDSNSDKRLDVDEFNFFNKKIKDKQTADFQILDNFSDFDYNSSRNLDIEEYEDFFMKYQLVKWSK